MSDAREYQTIRQAGRQAGGYGLTMGARSRTVSVLDVRYPKCA